MPSTKELSILITARDLASAALRGAQREVGNLESRVKTASGNVVRNLTRIGVVAAGAMLAGFAVAVKSAGEFQQQMELLHTQAGVAQSDIAGLSKAVLDMSGQVGTSADILAQGLYHIESTGLRGAKALDALRIAAEGAKVGNTDLESTATALAGVIMTGIKGTESMGIAMGSLNAIVGAGNMRMADLVAALSTGILPSAKAAGLTLTDVGAALAQMADQTVPPEEGATRLRMTLALMAASTPKATKALASIGIGQFQLGNDMRKPNGLLVALTDLKSHLDKSGLSATEANAVVVRAFGGGKSSGAIQTLLGNLDLLKQKYAQITAGANNFDDAWEQTRATAAFQWGQLKTNIEAVGIRIGAVLLPKVNEVVGKLNEWIGGHGALVDKIASAGVTYFDKLSAFLKGLPWGAISDAFKLMGTGAKFLLDAFLGMPSWVQTAVITGWGFNKLAGGVPGKILGDALWGAASGLLKKIFNLNTAVANVKAGVVNVSGAIPGVGGGGGGAVAAGEGAAMGGLRGLINKLPIAVVGAIDIAAIAGVVATWFKVNSDVQVGAKFESDIVTQRQATDNLTQLEKLRSDLEAQKAAGGGDPLSSLLKGIFVNGKLNDQLDELNRKIAALGGPPPAPSGGASTGARNIYETGAALPGGTYRPGVPGSGATHVTVVVSDYATRHPTGMTVGPNADYAARHPQVQKPRQLLTASEFLKDLRSTAFIGTDAYKSIWEKIGGKGRDPFGQQFLTILQNVKPALLKTPLITNEVAGHIKELRNLEKFYLSKGQTANAAETARTIAAIERLMGITRSQSAAQQATTAAVQRGHAATQRGFTALEGVDRGILAKKTSVSVHASIPVTVNNWISINEWQRKAVSVARSNANYGGFI